MVDIQKLRFDEPLPHRTAEHEIQSQSAEANEAPPVKRLDKEVTRLGEIAFAGGMYCEVWVGRWEKGGGERGSGEGVGGEKSGDKGAGGEKGDVEKVNLNLITFILLISP